MKFTTCFALCGAIMFSAPASATSTMVYAGYTAARDSWSGYVGGVTALGLGHDLYRDGLLLRADGSYGGFDYDRPGNPAGGVDTTPKSGDVMIGYRKYFSTGAGVMKGGYLGAYVGGDWQHIDLNKVDTANPAQGSELGVKGLAELRLDLTGNLFASATGSYSSAFDSYWTNARIGYDFARFSFGPEVSYLGNESYDQQRLGVFIGDIRLLTDLHLNLSGGYENSDRRGQDGAYGDANITLAF